MKNTLASEYACCFLLLSQLGTDEISTVGIFTNLNPLVAGLFFVRHMKSILVPSLPLRVYGPMRSTYNAP
jgi:hypothetical protein